MSFSELELPGLSSDHPADSLPIGVPTIKNLSVQPPQTLHRIREVRREQGVAIRRAAQLMGKTVDEARAEEEPTTDLTLSELYEWQRLLEVPAADLLEEPHAPLSAPVLRRAQLLRLMKTAQAIMERATQPSVRRLSQTMISQLVEIMPELEGVTPWHASERQKTNRNSRELENTYLAGETESELPLSPPNSPR